MPTTKVPTRQGTALSKTDRTKQFSPGMILFAGWLVPGLGHLLQGYRVRALLLFASIVSMFALGLAMQGRIYAPNTNDMLEMLGFIGDLGNGVLFILSGLLGWGQNVVQVVTQDYGTKFIVVAGLLNFISAIDAHSLRLGRKR